MLNTKTTKENVIYEGANDEFALSIFFLGSNCPLMLLLNATCLLVKSKNNIILSNSPT